MRFLLEALVLLAVLAAVTGISLLAGAPNLGTALGVGQIGFTVALVAVILRR